MSPVVAADGRNVYVCNRFNNNVGIVDLAARRQVATVAATREPIAAALAGDGKTLVVANLLPTGTADGDYTSARVDLIDVAARRCVNSLNLPNGSTGLRGVCVSADGRTAFVTHILARYHLPTTQLERGWMNTNALTVIDLAAGKIINTRAAGRRRPWSGQPLGPGRQRRRQETLRDARWLAGTERH